MSNILETLKKFISRKFLTTVVIAPLLTQYAMAHGWPPAVIEWLLGLIGAGVAGQTVVDSFMANRGIMSNGTVAKG